MKYDPAKEYIKEINQLVYKQVDTNDFNPFAYPGPRNHSYLPMTQYRNVGISYGHQMGYVDDDESEGEWMANPPEYYNVKKANIAPMKDYKYETAYKQNKTTGRVLRYFICKYENCNRKFNKTWNFIDHVRIHTGEKPYRCHICGKGFTQKGNYNKHKTLHPEMM